jgi:hypothetical protein
MNISFESFGFILHLNYVAVAKDLVHLRDRERGTNMNRSPFNAAFALCFLFAASVIMGSAATGSHARLSDQTVPPAYDVAATTPDVRLAISTAAGFNDASTTLRPKHGSQQIIQVAMKQTTTSKPQNNQSTVKGKDLQSQDRHSNTQIQDLMSSYNQAEGNSPKPPVKPPKPPVKPIK